MNKTYVFSSFALRSSNWICAQINIYMNFNSKWKKNCIGFGFTNRCHHSFTVENFPEFACTPNVCALYTKEHWFVKNEEKWTKISAIHPPIYLERYKHIRTCCHSFKFTILLTFSNEFYATKLAMPIPSQLHTQQYIFNLHWFLG